MIVSASHLLSLEVDGYPGLIRRDCRSCLPLDLDRLAVVNFYILKFCRILHSVRYVLLPDVFRPSIHFPDSVNDIMVGNSNFHYPTRGNVVRAIRRVVIN